MRLDPATEAYQKYGYNDRPVDAELGPHRFRIPANYFRDQIGPDFQGNFSLLVQWPDLEPLPPGKRSGQDMDTFDRQITISPNYIDRVPIETLLEAYTVPIAPPGSPSLNHPGERLDQMIALPERDGLTPYRIDTQRLEAFRREEAARLGMPLRPLRPGAYQDWFARRDGSGKILTLIRCDQETEASERRRPQCTHDFTIPELSLAISAQYPKEFIGGWQRIEDRARKLLADTRVE